MSREPALNRREFVKVTSLAGAGFIVAAYLQACQQEPTETARPTSPPLPTETQMPTPTPDPNALFEPNLYLRVDGTGAVTITVHRPELGEGTRTAFAMIVAEELDTDWSAVKIEQAPADSIYGNQTIGGSTAISDCYSLLRRAGAQARAMIVEAAAQEWGVEPETCTTESSTVFHEPSGRQFSYADLVELAGTIEKPDIKYKDPNSYVYIGTPIGRMDNPEIVTGSAQFASDITVPGMLYATLARCPVYRGEVVSFDATKAKDIQGVQSVVEISNGVAVVAESTWAAIQGQRALEITWDEGSRAEHNSENIRQRHQERLDEDGDDESDPDVLRADYEVPFFAHVTAEPMNCVADVRADSCEIWAPTQVPMEAKQRAASITGLPNDAVVVHIPLVGGGFGRRLQVDYVGEAVEISSAVGAPVKLFWTREDDIHHDYFHPYSYNRARTNLNNPSRPNIFSVSIGILRTGAWRSVPDNFDVAFVRECFIDEMAEALSRDPLELRLEVEQSSLHRVLEVAAEKAGWGDPLPEGWGRGIACHSTWNATPVAQVAEVSVSESGTIRVHKVVCAVDCGLVINPNMVEEQMEGGIVFGLTAALKESITFENGRAQQSNFHDYPLLRFDEMPEIDVHILQSEYSPSGVGEMGVPPIAPAVANAIFDATGIRLRRLPFRKEDLISTT
ncbi:MAG: molybdopterin-dependent oxidoreductase [Anaerolineales bacterium]|nr:molybdopterin-dependent oxidoreductase [Anaerolineales bacterium]